MGYCKKLGRDHKQITEMSCPGEGNKKDTTFRNPDSDRKKQGWFQKALWTHLRDGGVAAPFLMNILKNDPPESVRERLMGLPIETVSPCEGGVTCRLPAPAAAQSATRA